jgi:HK97 gp10 family phage protein
MVARVTFVPDWHHKVKTTELLRSIAEDIAADARDLCPVDTGTLRDSIAVEAAEENLESGPSISIVAKTDYAAFVEEGTRTHRAQPFLRPALNKHRSSAKGL